MNKEKLVRFGSIVKRRFTGADVDGSSVLIAFYLLLSLFPLLIVVGNILVLLGIDHHSALEYAALVVPEVVMPVLEPVVENLLVSASGGFLSLGVLAAVWSSSRGVVYMQRAMDKAYGIPGNGNFIVKRLVSLVTILLILLLLVAFVALFSVGDIILQALSPFLPWAGSAIDYLKALKWPVTLGFLFAFLVLVYRVTPDVKLRVRDVLPGAAVATVGLVALVQLFTIYVAFSTRSLNSYGVLGTFFVMMYWLKYTAVVVILGAVVNASIREYRFGKAQEVYSSVDAALDKTRDNLIGRLKSYLDRRRKK